jgi:hypothetical protein
MSAIREQVGPDAYMTTGVVMAYDSFSPAREVSEPIEEPIEP